MDGRPRSVVADQRAVQQRHLRHADVSQVGRPPCARLDRSAGRALRPRAGDHGQAVALRRAGVRGAHLLRGTAPLRGPQVHVERRLQRRRHPRPPAGRREMTDPFTVGAVVVNYNAGDHLVRCVAALRAESIEQIAVVDNGSRDGSVAVMKRSDPEVLVVDTGDNLGYGRAANRGAKVLAPMPDAVLVSNPDVVVHPGTVKALVAALEDDPALGIVGPRIENPDGTVYPSARTFPILADAVGHAFLGMVAPRNRWTRRYRMLDWDHSTAQSVDWISGACFLVRARTWADIGGFDESFFMYMEDVDLCWRARAHGWGVAYEPAGRVTHVQGVSTDRQPYRMIVAHHRSMFRFAARTTTGRARLLLPLMAVGMAARTALACAERLGGSRRSRDPASIR